MKKIWGLTKEYIKVERKENGIKTYGGDQNFFSSPEASTEDARKQGCGCGIVAFADLLLYLGSISGQYRIQENLSYVNRILSEEEYKQYYNSIYDFMGGIKGKVGISGLKIQRSFNRLARREKWSLRAKWALSGKKLYDRTEEMLMQDIPVICCIPMMLLKKDKNDYLPLYRLHQGDDLIPRLEKASYTRAHYVMITGINVIGEDTFYQVSSWGKQFYISRNEYDTFIGKHFLGTILGNILYVSKR
ncbi:MAG: hypothetical protein IJD96_06300 [Lachnospiraceae bacterium]|nr:hypothetical protein [Lachnospiraceae bacterium]